MHILQGFFPTIEALLYTKQNLTAVTIRRSKGFGIHPHIAEKRHTLLMSGTLGHTVPYNLQDGNREHSHGQAQLIKMLFQGMVGRN